MRCKKCLQYYNPDVEGDDLHHDWTCNSVVEYKKLVLEHSELKRENKLLKEMLEKEQELRNKNEQ